MILLYEGLLDIAYLKKITSYFSVHLNDKYSLKWRFICPKLLLPFERKRCFGVFDLLKYTELILLHRIDRKKVFEVQNKRLKQFRKKYKNKTQMN